ncbi:MAG: hypothetical protein ABIP51_05095 [Bacteroidia bacterium]
MAFNSNKNKGWTNFEREVLTIPSNEFVAKALNRPKSSVSTQRAKGNGAYPKAGKYKLTQANIKMFMPMLTKICIANMQPANFPMLDSLEKIARLKNPNVTFVPTNGQGTTAKKAWPAEHDELLLETVGIEIKERKEIFKNFAIEWGRSYTAVDKRFSNLMIARKSSTPIISTHHPITEKKITGTIERTVKKTIPVFNANINVNVAKGTKLSIAGQEIFLEGIFLNDGDLLKFENGKLVRNQTL